MLWFKKNSFGHYLILKKWLIRYMGIMTHRRYRGFNNLKIAEINQIYINKGQGSFAGIRNSLSIVKAFHVVNKIDYYCFSFKDFGDKNDAKYENIPELCKEIKAKKNLINPIYLS